MRWGDLVPIGVFFCNGGNCEERDTRCGIKTYENTVRPAVSSDVTNFVRELDRTESKQYAYRIHLPWLVHELDDRANKLHHECIALRLVLFDLVVNI